MDNIQNPKALDGQRGRLLQLPQSDLDNYNNNNSRPYNNNTSQTNSGVISGKNDNSLCSNDLENNNVEGPRDQGPVSALVCISCDFVANSMEVLGSHYIATHFLASNDDSNNNTQPSCKPADVTMGTVAKDFKNTDALSSRGIYGGFAKKYRAKKHKPVYAIISKQNQTGKETDETKVLRKKLGDGIAVQDGNKNTGIIENMSAKHDGVKTKHATARSTHEMHRDKVKGVKDNIKAYNDNDVKAYLDDGEDVRSTSVELLSCLVCGCSFGVKGDLQKHLTKIHRLTNLCQLCYYKQATIQRFANPVSLRNHKLRYHPGDMVKCTCGAMLIDDKMLTSHLRKFRCDQTGPDTWGKQMVKCVCGKRFGSQELLLAHKLKCRKRSHDDDLENRASAVSYKGVCQTQSGSRSSDSGPGISSRSSQMHGAKSAKRVTDDIMPNWSLKKRLLNAHKLHTVKKSHTETEETVYKTTESKQFAETSSRSITEENKSKGNQGRLCLTFTKLRPSATRPSWKITGHCKKSLAAERRYLCSICRGRFRRPYLYVHQRTVHRPRQLVAVAAPRPSHNNASSSEGVTYRCFWCRFVAVHWRTVVHHHYSRHQDRELDVIAIVTRPLP